MNQQLKTILLTILTLSVFVIALVELSGVSKTALIHKFGGDDRSDNTAAKELPKTKMTFDNKQFDFGTITEGDKPVHAFRFTNTGSNPLVISDATPSCGCTVASFPKQPIPPGGTGEIVVNFNSANRVGHQHKNIMIYSNAEEDASSIGFDVEVKPRP